ncbi:MAG: hypothetical protein BEU00_00450 [Marine Group III euryarchaeote CG-Epi3]|uniref:CARDB domain-containing protein n=1 Tax=Marine Group III euryarchaeote CG-Epi3 TaxID=1888997 RepID=A0A1J5U4M3_9ARCH|nr:MAG: hypothetical protein BEU00_00450 [Marine Group III euryarchaeote CG-Epi3]
MDTNLKKWLVRSLAFALICFGFLVVSGSADAGYSHKMSVTPTQQEGEPDEQLQYTITIENEGEDDTYNLSVTDSSIPAGFTAFIIPAQLTIDEDESATATLFVKIGNRTNSNAEGGDTHTISFKSESVQATGETKTALASLTVKSIYGTTITAITGEQNVEPNKNVKFAMSVKNTDGNTDDSVTISYSANGIDDWDVNPQPSTMTLSVDGTGFFNLSVTPDIAATAGLKSITVLATSEDGETVSSTSVTVKVIQLPALQVDKSGSSSRDVEAGKRVYYSFSVTNKGNAVDTFDLAVDDSSLPAGWDASLDQDTISNLGVNEKINLTDVLVVKAPNDAAAEEEVSIVVTISSEFNSSINSTYTSRSTVLQKYDPKVSIVGLDTLSAKPEEQVNFTIKIENLGNGEDDIDLELIGGNSSWGQLGDSSFTLDANENDTTTLRVTPPKDTEAKNGYILTIKGTSEDGTTITTRNIFVNVLQTYEVSVQVSGDSSKKGDPGDELVFEITVKNKGNGEDTVSLSLEGGKSSWGSIVDEVELVSGETKTVNLTVNIDDDATVGDNDIIVNGTSEDNPSAFDTGTVKVSVNKQFKVDVVVSSKSGDPGSTVAYDVRIQNEGTGNDTFTVNIDDYPAGWSVDPVSFQVEDIPAGGEKLVRLNVSIRSGEDNKAFTINLTASSDEAQKENPPKYANKTVSIITIVNQEYWIDLSVADSDRTVEATVGVPVSITIDVDNLGTGDDIIAMTNTPPEGWTGVDFSNPFINVAEGNQEEVTLTITVPESTSKGDYSLVVKGVSDCEGCENGTKSTDSITLTVKVDLSRGVEVSTDVTEIEKLPGTTASFTIDVKNTGDGADNLIVSILDDDLGWAFSNTTSLTLDKDQTGSVTVNVTLPEYVLDNLTNQERNALQANTYSITVKVKSGGDLSVSDTASLQVDIGQIYGAKVEIVGANSITSYPSTETQASERTEKFTFKLTNTGNGQDTVNVETIATTYPDEWNVEIFQNPSCASSFTGSIGAGQSKYLYLCIEPDQDSDIGNYTVLTEFSPNDGIDPAVQVSVNLEVASPRRELDATAIDSMKEIYPEYEGSTTQNSVKFKVKLDNTGSNDDIFIPEVESTLEDGWTVTFFQDSSKTQSWPNAGVTIEEGELDDLWVFISVNDEAEVGNETVKISVRNEEDDPNARQEIDLKVVIQRPEIVIKQSNIRIEIDGVFGNASQVKDGDTVVIYVDVENTGSADADDVNVEIYYYPKKAPTTQQEIDELLIAGFEFDDSKNTYIYQLYGSSGRSTNIKEANSKELVSDDWLIKGGEWYVEARADYDNNNDNGEILEENENNNDARYSELLRVKPDLQITAMRVDSKYAGTNAGAPNVDDTVTFTVTVTNAGAADVDNSRLYITADSSTDNEVLKDRTNQDYVLFDLDAGETQEVRFRWKAQLEEWTAFSAEVNPVCDDFNIQDFTCESEGDGFSTETGRMFDELGRYSDNVWPRSGVFEQSGEAVEFSVLPDFKIKKVVMDPTSPQVGEDVDITVTVENIGNADWQISSKPLQIKFEDSTGTELSQQISESINKDDSTEVSFTWTVPEKDNKDFLTLTWTIDAGTGSFEIQQCNDCDLTNNGDGTDNDEYVMEDFELQLAAVLGEIELINSLTERELVKGVPLLWPVAILAGILVLGMVAIPVLRRRGGSSVSSDPEEESEGEESPAEETAAAPPSKISVAIVSTIDGKTANVKVPSNMPVNKLLQNCVGKFPLPHANFAVMLNGVAVDNNLTLADAGLTDKCQVDLVPLE